MLPISRFALFALFLLEEEPFIFDPGEELGKAVWGQLVPRAGQQLQQQGGEAGGGGVVVRVGAAAELEEDSQGVDKALAGTSVLDWTHLIFVVSLPTSTGTLAPCP